MIMIYNNNHGFKIRSGGRPIITENNHHINNIMKKVKSLIKKAKNAKKFTNNKQTENETNLQWKSTPFTEKPTYLSWSEDAINSSGNVVYKLYYNSLLKETTLEDIREGITYHITIGSKAKGYMLGFKLNTSHVRKMKKIRDEKNT